MSKRFIIAVSAAAFLLALVILLRTTAGTHLVWNISGEGKLLLPLLIVSAILDSIHPCAFAILLVTIAVMLGLGALRRKLYLVGGTYIAGIFVAYLGIGLGLLGTLHLFGVPNFMGRFGALVLIVWGSVNLLNRFVPAFPVKLQIPQSAHHKMAELMGQASVPAAFVLGLLVGMCAFPCTGGPYLVVLGLLHDTKTYAQGALYLLLYNALFVLPLVVVLSIVGDKTLVGKLESWKKENAGQMRTWLGIIMIALGVLLLFL